MSEGARSAIVKSGSQQVRPYFVSAHQESSTSTKPALAATKRSPMVELMEKLALCEAEIAEHETALAKAHAEGEAAGRLAAEDDFEEDRAQALEKLSEGVEEAVELFRAAVADFDKLALAAAHEALRVLIGDTESYGTILEAAIKRQLRRIEEASIIAVTVSRADFPDSRESDAVAAAIGAPVGRVAGSDELEPGCCEIKLKLGVVEFDFGKNWQQISEILKPDGGAAA